MKQSLERSGFPRQIDILFPSRPLLETVTFRQLTARYYDCPPADICPSSPLTDCDYGFFMSSLVTIRDERSADGPEHVFSQ